MKGHIILSASPSRASQKECPEEEGKCVSNPCGRTRVQPWLLLWFGHADDDEDDASRGKRDVGGDSTDAGAATSPNRQPDLLTLERRQMKALLLLLQKCKRNNKITSDVAFLLQSFNATSFLLRNGKPKQNQTKTLDTLQRTARRRNLLSATLNWRPLSAAIETRSGKTKPKEETSNEEEEEIKQAK